MYKYFWECFYHLEPEDNHPHIPKEMLARYFKHTHTHTQPNNQTNRSINYLRKYTLKALEDIDFVFQCSFCT